MTKLKVFGTMTAIGFAYLITIIVYLLIGSWLISGLICITFTVLQFLQLNLLLVGIRAVFEYLKS